MGDLIDQPEGSRIENLVVLIEVKKSFQDPDSSLLYFKERLNPEVAIQLHTEINRSVFVKKVTLISVAILPGLVVALQVYSLK